MTVGHIVWSFFLQITSVSSVTLPEEWHILLKRHQLPVDKLLKRGVRITQTQSSTILDGRLEDLKETADNIEKELIERSLCDIRKSVRPPDNVDQQNRLTNGYNDAAADTARQNGNNAADNGKSAGPRVNGIAGASSDKTEDKIYIDEPVWTFLKKDPNCHSLLSSLSVSAGDKDDVVELKGEKRDILKFCELCEKYDLQNVIKLPVKLQPGVKFSDFESFVKYKSPVKHMLVKVVQLADDNCYLLGKNADVVQVVSELKHFILIDDRHLSMLKSPGSDPQSKMLPDKGAAGNKKSHVSPANSVSSLDSHLSLASGVAGASGGSNDVEFTTRAGINVRILVGDLTKQKTEVIVNPANCFLHHFGGAAKAIADAAGPTLTRECESYIKMHRKLRTSEVMDTTSGRLRSPIRYVIHAVGPNVKDYPNIGECMRLLNKTFLNCFVHANDILKVKSMSVPAISSGQITWLIYLLLYLT